MAPKKVSAHVEGKALTMNNKLTHSEAQQKCIDWIVSNPDKCLHLCGMMTLGLCEPKEAEPEEPTGKKGKKIAALPNIPVTKTTLGQVSHRHIVRVVSGWHPCAEDWVVAYGPRTAHQLFYFATASHEQVSVHEHNFEKFSLFYTIRYQAMGSKLSACVHEVDAQKGFPWQSMGWYRMQCKPEEPGQISVMNCCGTSIPLPAECSATMDWTIENNWCLESAALVSPTGLNRTYLKKLFEQSGDFKGCNFSMEPDKVEQGLKFQAETMGLEVGLGFESLGKLQTPAKPVKRKQSSQSALDDLAVLSATTPKKARTKI